MPYAVTLRLDMTGARAVEALWQAIDASGIARSVSVLGYDPHITLARQADLDPLATADLLDQFAAGLAPIEIEMTAVGIFEHPTPVVWLATAENSALHALHRSLRGLFPSAAWHPQTEPAAWQPHIALVTEIADAQAFQRIQAFVAERFTPFACRLDRLELVRFPPVHVLESIPLEGAYTAGRAH